MRRVILLGVASLILLLSFIGQHSALAGSTTVFQLHGDNKAIYKWDGHTSCPDVGTCPGWGTPLDRNPATVQITGCLGSLCQLHGDTGAIYKWDGHTSCPDVGPCLGWGIPLDRNPTTVAIAGSEGALFQLHGDTGAIYKWDGHTSCPDVGTCLGWGTPLERNPATTKIAAAEITDPPPPIILIAHNTFRHKHCVPPLQWSAELAANAQTWANGCHKDAQGTFCHQNICGTTHTSFGENLGFRFELSNGHPVLPGLTPEQAVSDWYCEIQNYNFDQPILNLGFVSKACMPPVNGHFTQVVWKETTLLGCASNTCQDKDGHQGTLWVCEYSPPGNNPQTLSQNVLKPTCQ